MPLRTIAAGEVLKPAAIIDGERVFTPDGQVFESLCPSDGKVIAVIPRCDAAEVGRAVAAARKAFETGPWPKLTAADRGRLLMKLSALVTEHHDELSALESLDAGKPLKQGKADITALARYFEFYGGAADKVMGDTIPTADGFLAMTLREPHGVVGGIIPWNYPAQIMGRVAGAALAMGNTLVLKPAEDACLSVLRVAELALEAGFPAGVFNVVPGLGSEAGAALSNHPGLDYLTFTGSPEVGVMIQTAAAKNHIGCTLELGGKSPQIVFDDADLGAALPVIVNAIIQNCGQTCSAGSRVLVHKGIWDEVVEGLRTRIRALVSGPHSADLDLGPLINAGQLRRVQSFVDRALADGIPLVAEGAVAPDASSDGYFVPARVFGPVPVDHVIAREEIFGPVLSLIPFRDEEEALRIANGTEFGLVAGVWTRDAQRAVRVAKAVRAGQVFVNAYGAGGGIELPFGGFKKSGHGREKGFEALYDFSATKTLVLRHG